MSHGPLTIAATAWPSVLASFLVMADRSCSAKFDAFIGPLYFIIV